MTAPAISPTEESSHYIRVAWAARELANDMEKAEVIGRVSEEPETVDQLISFLSNFMYDSKDADPLKFDREFYQMIYQIIDRPEPSGQTAIGTYLSKPNRRIGNMIYYLQRLKLKDTLRAKEWTGLIAFLRQLADRIPHFKREPSLSSSEQA